MLINHPLEIYEPWFLDKPYFPPRSRLYPLEPINLGTPDGESLNGYMARLAEEHSIPTGVLILKEIVPLMKNSLSLIPERYNSQSKEGGLDKLFAQNAESFNGSGKWTIALIQILETLTSRTEFRYLTMLPWAEIIPKKNLLKPLRAWCPVCYSEQRQKKQKIYEPLLWSLNPVKICPHHDRLLVTQCPHCLKNNKSIAWRSRPGYCSKCGEWLGILIDEEVTENNLLNQNELEWESWVANNIGKLIAAGFYLQSVPSKEKIAEILSTYAQKITDNNISALARIINCNVIYVHRWIKGLTLPTIDNLSAVRS